MRKRKKVRRWFPWLPQKAAVALALGLLLTAAALAARSLHPRPALPPAPEGLTIASLSEAQEAGRWYVEGRVENATGATISRARYVLSWHHRTTKDIGAQAVVEIKDLRPGQARGFREPVHGYTPEYTCSAELIALDYAR